MLDRDKLLVQDEIEADKPAEVWWFMHTPAAVEVTNDGRTALLQQVGAQLRVELLSPASAQFAIINAQPLPTSPQPARQAKNETFKKLAIHLASVTAARIAVLLSATPAGRVVPPSPTTLHDLSSW